MFDKEKWVNEQNRGYNPQPRKQGLHPNPEKG